VAAERLLPEPKPSRWKRFRVPALTFVMGVTLGFGLAAPSRGLGSLLAGLGDPKAVSALLARQTSTPPILVLGSDQVSGNTDVMFAVRVGDGLTRVTQVPRDTFVESPSLGVQKVEALGGVDVDVPKRMYYVDNAQGLFIDLYPGRQNLKGRELEGFLRFRHDETGDLGRMDRQRLVINEIFRKLAQPATLVRLPALLKIAGEDIETNLSPVELSTAIGLMGRSKFTGERLPGRMYWQDDLSYWMPDSNKQHPTGPGQEPTY